MFAVPGQIFGGPNEVKSIQPMASLLGQALFLLTDIVVMLLIERKGVSVQAMQESHTDLEGLPARLHHLFCEHGVSRR